MSLVAVFPSRTRSLQPNRGLVIDLIIDSGSWPRVVARVPSVPTRSRCAVHDNEPRVLGVSSLATERINALEGYNRRAMSFH
jgi:hypothetical protein